jgi:hypothetical protein
MINVEKNYNSHKDLQQRKQCPPHLYNKISEHILSQKIIHITKLDTSVVAD